MNSIVFTSLLSLQDVSGASISVVQFLLYYSKYGLVVFVHQLFSIAAFSFYFGGTIEGISPILLV